MKNKHTFTNTKYRTMFRTRYADSLHFSSLVDFLPNAYEMLKGWLS
jgi:hypothetical protein